MAAHEAQIMINHSDAWINITPVEPKFCTADISRNICMISSEELAKRNAIAGVRLIVSFLSIVGSLSIIVSVITRRQISQPKVHPIFVLSVADFLLATLWVIGAVLWLTDAYVPNKVWCFLPSVMTVILECVAVNLTLVYAYFSYSSLKRRNVTGILSNMDRSTSHRICTTVFAYALAWLVPIVIIMTAFGLISARSDIIQNANKCSCWCLPYFGNVLPLSFSFDPPTATYAFHVRTLIATYGAVVGTNYLAVFILLLIVYFKLLRHIRRMRTVHEQMQTSYPQYGAVNTLLVEGQSKARKRVVYFLTVFIITGLFNVAIAYAITIYEAKELHQGIHLIDHHMPTFVLALYLFQSLTVPMQGFLNALVYGWTGEDFRRAIGGAISPQADLEDITSSTEPEARDYSGSSRQNHSGSGSFRPRSSPGTATESSWRKEQKRSQYTLTL